jgi:GDP-L-fucose synthase
MKKSDKIFVAGHRGLVGSAIVRRLRAEGYENLITTSRAQTDLRDAHATEEFFRRAQPDYVFLAAAKVGGILANATHPVEFLRDNLLIELNVIHSAHQFGAKKIEFLGSSCIYPKFAPQPIGEDSLLTGSLEPTNEWYAIAKIAGIKLCQAYRQQHGLSAICLMPTNLYGPGDNFDLQSSHVLPALIRKFHEAKETSRPEVSVWGSGNPRREFLHVDDLAVAALHFMLKYDSPEIVNIGTGDDITIRGLAEMIQHAVGFEGRIVFDDSKPDGTPRKLLDIGRAIAAGWTPTIQLAEGIQATYEWYLRNQVSPIPA